MELYRGAVELHSPALYSPNLYSPAELAALDAERDWAGAKLDTVQLAADLLRVRGKDGRLQPLLANRAQLAFEASHRRESVVLKARQMGLSTWIVARFLLRSIALPGTVTVHVAHTREAALLLFGMVRRMWQNLPEGMRHHGAKLVRNKLGEFAFANGSEIRIVSAAEPNAGRGLTMTNLHCSELARWQGDAAETLAGLRAALAPGGELVMESTPNGAHGPFYEAWRDGVDALPADGNGVLRHFCPWWWEPGYVVSTPIETSSLTEEEQALLGLGDGPTLQQIGFRRELAARFGALRRQEFAEDAATCFRESGSCAFELAPLLARLAELHRTPPALLRRERNGALDVWLPPQPGRHYVLGADPAGGTADGDFAALQVVDGASGMQCAELHGRLSPKMLAAEIAALAIEYNGALIAVERNNHGPAVLAYLEREEACAAPGTPPLRHYVGSDGGIGWWTGRESRAAMLAGLQVLLATRADLLRSRRLLEECRTFVLAANGRTEAAPGTHDDLVFAMAIAQAVRVER